MPRKSTKRAAKKAAPIEQPIEQIAPSEQPIPPSGGWTRKIDPETGHVVADRKVSDDGA